MGGMAAQIPIAGNAAANDAAMARVRADKLREAEAGHDGTWVAHPAPLPLAREGCDADMPGAHQHALPREDPGARPGPAGQVTAAHLLAQARGTLPPTRFGGHVTASGREHTPSPQRRSAE